MIEIHFLKLGSHLQAGSFEEFALTHYLPSLQAPEGSRGQLLGISLLRRRRTGPAEALDVETNFLLVSEWSGDESGLPRIGEVTVQRLFDAYGVGITRLGDFEVVASSGRTPDM